MDWLTGDRLSREAREDLPFADKEGLSRGFYGERSSPEAEFDEAPVNGDPLPVMRKFR